MKKILHANDLNKKNIVLINIENEIYKSLKNKLIELNSNIIIADYFTKEKTKNKNVSIYKIDKNKNIYNEYTILCNLIKRKYKHIDVLIINNTKIPNLTPIEYIEIDNWINTINNNINYSFLIIKTLIPLLKLSNNGLIILNAYHQKKIEKAFMGEIACSNAFLISLMKIINEEHKNSNKVRVNIIDINK